MEHLLTASQRTLQALHPEPIPMRHFVVAGLVVPQPRRIGA